MNKIKCINCKSERIVFKEWRGLNQMYHCNDCGLLFSSEDKDIRSVEVDATN